ncbi:MAG: hypothetical protein FJX74_17990, partial [Armatimonadetes bacterium]|nr:hypothetical protein [Armatimonadota bacterium]
MSDWEALAETVTRNRAWTGKRLDGAPVWDYCVVTASTPQQAALYRWELQSRREGGHLPLSPTRYLAVADPPGPRIGSGGGLLWALQAVAHDLRRRAPAAARRGGAALQLPRRRILIIQSGG